MDNELESESYWHRSTRKAFNFDDDDETEVDSSSSGLKWDLLNDDEISEASFDNSISVGAALNLSIKSVLSEENLKQILQEQTLEDRIISNGVTAEEELKLLRRQLQTTVYNPSPEVTAQKLLLGKSVSLEVFKSLHEKEQLLDAVLKSGGGDGIIAVLLFLKKTLKNSLFHKILQTRRKALKHFLSYLQLRHSAEFFTICKEFDLYQEACLALFSEALSYNDIDLRKQHLRQLLEQSSSHANHQGVINLYQQIFNSSLKLLELLEKESSALNDVQLDSTPIEVLYACCRKHNNWKEQDLVHVTSPFRFCTDHQISAAQFEWTALNERARAQAYADLESVFERVPTWHPIKQKQFHISFSLEAAVLRLFALNAPATVLYMFLSKISDSNEKLELAQQVKCTRAVIDALVGLKDVQQLTQLKENLPERSEEQFYCEKGLKSLQSKRWSTDNIKLKL